jgi:phage tail tape-measure protein
MVDDDDDDDDYIYSKNFTETSTDLRSNSILLKKVSHRPAAAAAAAAHAHTIAHNTSSQAML